MWPSSHAWPADSLEGWAGCLLLDCSLLFTVDPSFLQNKEHTRVSSR